MNRCLYIPIAIIALALTADVIASCPSNSPPDVLIPLLYEKSEYVFVARVTKFIDGDPDFLEFEVAAVWKGENHRKVRLKKISGPEYRVGEFKIIFASYNRGLKAWEGGAPSWCGVDFPHRTADTVLIETKGEPTPL